MMKAMRSEMAYAHEKKRLTSRCGCELKCTRGQLPCFGCTTRSTCILWMMYCRAHAHAGGLSACTLMREDSAACNDRPIGPRIRSKARWTVSLKVVWITSGSRRV